MIPRFIWMAFAVVLIACGYSAFASLYFWHDKMRPPISLRDALARADELLGPDGRNRYCVSVSLYGSKEGDGKSGAWNLLYAAADGSKKNIHVNMRGEGRVDDWNGPIDWTKNAGARTSLEDVRQRLQTLFEKEGMNTRVTVADNRLTAAYLTRTYKAYPDDGNGNFGERLEEMTGPKSNRIWLEVHVVEQPDWREQTYANGWYWQWQRATYALGDGRFLAVDLRYGKQVKREIVDQMEQIFGRRAP
jgi:hypothetical protein